MSALTDTATVSVRGLRVSSPTAELVHGVDLDIAPGERFGLIGESGSGKSLTAYALLGLLDEDLTATGEVAVTGVPGNVLDASESTMSRVRGRVASIVFQEPMTALNPLMKVGAQVAETLLWHGRADSRAMAHTAAVELLDQVRLPDPAHLAGQYPHQLSGGQRQRVVIAMALANDPALLVCDEPTTALDVTVQARVLQLISSLARARGSALLFISHDLAVVASVADRVAVMQHGRIVEQGPVQEVFTAPRHPYTRALIAASDLEAVDEHGRLGTVDSTHTGRTTRKRADQASAAPHDVLADDAPEQVFNAVPDGGHALLRIRDLRREYRGGRRVVHGLRGVSFDVREGQKLGIVGESGSGKSTLLRMVAALDRPTSGTVQLSGTDLAAAGRAELRRLRGDVSIVFQDPAASLDPRMPVSAIVAEPLRGLSRAETADRVREVIAAVGLPADAPRRYPHQFSGGQRQRISIARALVTRPQLLIADEPVSALDVSVRAQVLNLVADLADEYALTLLFISHDLGVVAHVCDTVLVLADGRIVEAGPTRQVLEHPRHQFTTELVAATPRLSDALAAHATPEEDR